MKKPHLVKWSKKKIERFWNIYQANEKYSWTPIWSDSFSDFFLFGIKEILKKLKKDAKILDFGCGNGEILKKLKRLGFYNLYGIDISRENIKKSKR